MRGLIRVLLTPSCWFQNYSYNKKFDRRLIELMKSNKFEYIDDYHVRLGDVILWIRNHPYASMVPMINGNNLRIRPSRITILEAYDKMVEDIL